MDVASGLAAVGQAISITKSLKELDKSYDAVALKSRIIELMEALLETKSALADAKIALDEKDKQLAAIKLAFDEKAELAVGDGDYKFKTDVDGKKLGYPICPKCEVTDGRVVQLKQNGHYAKARCPVCDAEFAPVTCYLPAGEATDAIDTVAKRAAENQRKANERLANLNRRSSWIDSRY